MRKKKKRQMLARVYMPRHTIQSERVPGTKYIREVWRMDFIDLQAFSPHSAKVTNTHTRPTRHWTREIIRFSVANIQQEKEKGKKGHKGREVKAAAEFDDRAGVDGCSTDSKINLNPRDFRNAQKPRMLYGLRGFRASRLYQCARPHSWAVRSPGSQRAWP